MWRTQERLNWMICLFFGGLGLYASRAVLPISSVLIANELRWNRQETGMIMGVFFWGYALTQYLAGYLSDKLGGELVICLSSFIWSVITLAFVYLPYVSGDGTTVYNLFVCGRFLLGFFQGFYYPSLASLMAKRVHSLERSFTYSVLNAGAHLGTLLCGSFGSYLVAAHGWRAPFACIGILCILWSVLTYVFMVRPKRRTRILQVSGSLLPCRISSATSLHASDPKLSPKSRQNWNNSDGDLITGSRRNWIQRVLHFRFLHMAARKSFSLVSHLLLAPSSSENKEVNNGKPTAIISNAQQAIEKNCSGSPGAPMDWDKLLRHPPFWVMLLANFVHNNSFYIILNWCPSYFHDNYPDARSWVFNMVPWLIIFPSVLVGGLLADSWISRGVSVTYVRKAITTIVLVGSSGFLLLLTVVDNYYTSLTCMAMALACLGFHCSGVLLNPQDLAPNHGGQLYGVMATFGTIPGFLGVYLAGYLLDVTHEWSVVFLLTSAISLVGWFAYFRYGSAEQII